MSERLRIREAVLVEGRYDAHAVREAAECVVLETGGFGVFRNDELRVLLRRLAEERGLIIFTDPDGAGFVIRSHLKGMLPEGKVKHAYIPETPGKERRKRVPGKEGLLGVEGMDAETIRKALLRAGAAICEPEDSACDDADAVRQALRRTPLEKADFYEWGLSGTPDSHKRREAVLRFLGFPVKMSPNAMLFALSALYSYDEAEDMIRQCFADNDKNS